MGVTVPLEGDILKGAKTFFALHTRHARSVKVVSTIYPFTKKSSLTFNISIRLDNLWCKFDTKPIPRSVRMSVDWDMLSGAHIM